MDLPYRKTTHVDFFLKYSDIAPPGKIDATRVLIGQCYRNYLEQNPPGPEVLPAIVDYAEFLIDLTLSLPQRKLV